MKKFIYGLIGLVLMLFVLAFIFIKMKPEVLVDRIIPRLVAQASVENALLQDKENIHLFTIGTSAPLGVVRVHTCNAVIVNGHFFVFDVGDGSVRAMELQSLPIADVDAVFLTHFHSDHYIDLPNMINRSWLLGRSYSLDIYGPTGTDTVVQAINTMLDIDHQHRAAHHGADLMNIEFGIGVPRQFDIDKNGSTIVFQQEGITIEAFDVRHEPVTPSVGYRITYKDKVLVISGDTRYTKNLVRHAEDADLLVQEVMLNDIMYKISAENKKEANPRLEKIAIDVTDYHSDISDALNIGLESGVKKMVLSHLAPSPDNFILKSYYSKAIRNYKGDIEVAEDGNHYIIE